MVAGATGPFGRALAHYPPILTLSFGLYAEASKGMRQYLKLVADRHARQWGLVTGLNPDAALVAIKRDLRKRIGLEMARSNARTKLRGAECVRTGKMLKYWESEDLSYFATDGARSRWDVERRAMVGFPARPEGWGAGNSRWGGH